MPASALHSLKTKLVGGFLAVLGMTLAMAALLSFGAQAMDGHARRASIADDEVRDLLAFALVSHRYMNAFEQSLGQRTLVANNERRIAAGLFEARLTSMPSLDSAHSDGLAWATLRTISQELQGELSQADELRAAGKFYDAERIFNRARKLHFERRMLPWFEHAIDVQRNQAVRLESAAIEHARLLDLQGSVLAAGAVLLSLLVLFGSLRALMRPIELLVAGATAIARGDYSHRIRYAEPNELGLLALRFDDMAAMVERSQQTLLEKNQALEEAYRLQGEFLSMMSHELRSPLHSILGYTELVLEDAAAQLAQVARRNVEHIATGAQRLLSLINDILDFSKLRAGRMQLKAAAFDPLRLAEDAVTDARALAQGRPVEVRLESAGVANELVSDETKVRQILTNLLSNAVKFCDRGQVVLRVESASDAVVFKVRDTGIGIANDQFGSIFEPFRQAAGAGRHVEGGTGLGLAIVSRLSGLLGGEVSVTSEPGHGSEFTVRLPHVPRSDHGEDSAHR